MHIPITKEDYVLPDFEDSIPPLEALFRASQIVTPK